MLFQIQNSMGSRSKVQEILNKFENRSDNHEEVQNEKKLENEKNSVLKRKEIFQRQHPTRKRPQDSFPLSNLKIKQNDDINVEIKHCKLRRNLPVTPRKNSPILCKREKKMENGTLENQSVIAKTSILNRLIDTDEPPKIRDHKTPQPSLRKVHTLSVATMVEALEEISKSPLPKGDPPAKPPRTFAHDTYIAQKQLKQHGSPIYDEVNESQNGNSMKIDKKIVKRLEPYAITDLYKDGKKTVFPPVPKRRSTFFVENERKLVRCLSDEHVYDEPCIGLGGLKSYSSDESLVMSKVIYDHINCQDVIEEEGLHYSSTPILKPRARSFTSRTKKHLTKSFRKNVTPNKATNSVREIVSRSFSSVRRRHLSEESGVAARRSSSEDDSGDSDNEITANELQKRIVYMRTVSRFLFKASSVKRERPYLLDASSPRIFDSVLVINLRDNETNQGYKPYVKLSYPLDCSTSDPKACPSLHFCFPDSEFWRPSPTGENYTFVLTNSKGDRTYGYCRRIKPDDAPASLPVVYCILSPVLSFKFYSKILHELEHRHGSPDAEIKNFLDTIYRCRMPRPGLVLRMPNSRTNSNEEVQRPLDSMSDDIGVEHLLKALDITNLIKIFASLLLERRIVLYSSNLTLLSRCVHSLVALLYPFVWQHTFIPILPSIAIDVIGSPTPFLVGVLSQFASKLRDLPMDQGDQVLMVDLDHNRLFHETGDENKVIPKKIQKGLILALKMAKSGPESSLLAVEAFLRLFVETVGHYGDFLVTQQDGKNVFERDSFSTALESHSITTFLQWFTETQMFNCFIDGLLEDNPASYGLFDKRIQEFRDEINAPQTLGKNFKDLGKKVKTLGERLIGIKAPEKSKINTS